MSFQQGAQLYSSSFGIRPENVEVPVVLERNPTTADYDYPIGKKWINSATNEVFVLTSQSSSSGTIIGNWLTLSDKIETISVNGGTHESPSASNNFDFSSPNGTMALGSSTGEITLDLNISSQGTVYYDGSGTFTGIDGSTSGKVLTSNGTGVPPSFQNVPVSTYYSMTPYIVGQVGDTHAQYNTIQSAITAAVSDGASSSNFKTILVKPGAYAGFTLADGISVVAFDFSDATGIKPVSITSTITMSSGESKLSGLYLVPSSGVSAITYTGGTLNLSFCSSLITSAVMIACSTATAKNLHMNSCYFQGDSSSSFIGHTNNNATFVIFDESSTIRFTGVVSTFLDSTVGWNAYDVTYALGINAQGTQFTWVFYGGSLASGGNLTVLTTGASTAGSFATHGTTILDVKSPFVVLGNANYSYANHYSTFDQVYTVTLSNGQQVPLTLYSVNNNADQALYLSGNRAGFQGADQVTKQAFINTADATPVVLFSIPVSELQSITVTGTITAAKSNHTDSCGGDFRITARRATAGNITAVGSPVSNVDSTSTATFAIGVDIGTQSVQMLVTGIAATSYNWSSTYVYQKILTNS